MAVTAREILLIFRGQNYMSQAIRRVGADIGGLSRGQQLANQRQMLQIRAQQLRNTRSIAQAELQSINVGSRRLSQEKAVAAQKLSQMRADSTLLRNQAQLSMLNRRVQTGTPLRGMTIQETEQLQRAAQISVAAQTESIANQSLAVQKLEADEAQLAARRAQLNEVVNSSSRGLDLNTQKLDQNAKAIRMLPFQKFSDGAARVEHLGRVIQMFGLITGAAMGYAADQAAKFNTSMVLAATQSTTATNNSTRNIVANSQVLQGAIQRLLTSGKTAAAPTDLSNGIYQIFSGLTFKGSQQSQLRQGLAILKDFNQVFTANYGQVQFNDVVTAGINLMNNFSISASKLPQVLNRMQASVRFGATNMSSFVSSLSQVVPAYRAAHYSFTQLAQDVAFVSRLFPQSLRTGTTGLARLTEMFARPNVIQGIEQQFHVNIAPGGQLLPISKIVQDLVKAKPDIFATSQAIGSFFKNVGGTQGTIQARRVLAGFVQEMGLYRTVAAQVGGDNNELARSFKAMQQTPGVRLQEFFNQLRGIVLELGAGAIPAFRAFVAPIEAAIRWFDQLNPRTQQFIGHAVALAGILALLGGSFLAVAGGIARLGAMAAMALKFMGGGSGLAGEAGLINIRLALLFGTVGTLVLAFTKFHSQIMAVINALGGLKNTIAVVVSIFAAWRLASYAIMIGRVAAETIGLATNIGEVGTAAKIATLETIGLRTALLGIAGLVVTATILIVSRKQVSSAGRNLLGDEINKEINAITAQPSPLSFGQKLGNWLFESPTTATKNLFNAFKPGGGGGDLIGWDQAIKQQQSGVGRIAVTYKAFLNLLGRPVGTPAALKQFLDLFSRRGLGKSSSSADIQDFLRTLQTASLGARNVHGLANQMDILRKTMFQLGHQDPFSDMNNRMVQAHMNALGLAQGLKDVQKVNQDIGKSAVQMGVVSTPAFKQLFANLVQAKLALKGHEGNVNLQRNVINAQTALQANVTKQQAQAAERAATAQAGNQITHAWQAATQQGIIATATYTRLYDAVQRAQNALQRDPTIANQRAYIAANNALQRYVNNATQANQQLANSAKTTFQDVVNSVTSMYQQLLQQNQTNFGTLFQGPFISSPAMQNFSQWGGKLTGRDLTKDLQSQVKQFHNFNNLLSNLQRRGAPQELINQLRALGPAAIQQIRALTQMSGPELRRYFGIFREGQRAVHQQTMRDLNRQLHDYLKYGRNIALQMIAGIRQEAPGITKAIERAVRRAFGNMGAVQGSATVQHNQTIRHHHHHHHHRGMADRRNSGEEHNHYTYQVTAPKDSNIDTQVRHAHFHNRNRHRRRHGVSSDRYR